MGTKLYSQVFLFLCMLISCIQLELETKKGNSVNLNACNIHTRCILISSANYNYAKVNEV